MLGSIALVIIALVVDAVLRQTQLVAFSRRARPADRSAS
jgi:hypothetical protein